MKKLAIALALFAALAASASAQMDQYVLSSTSITNAVGTDTAVIAGEIYSIRLVNVANKTNGVSITTAEGETVLAVAALAATATYYPVVPLHKASDGAAATFVGGTNNVANPFYGRASVVSTVTMTVTPDAGTTGTNLTKAIITFKK